MGKVQHMVLMQFKPGAPLHLPDSLLRAVAALREKIPGIVRFAGGPYSSPEGLNQGFSHGFLLTFADAACRNHYLSHPEHERLKADFLPALQNIVAFDFEERDS